MPTCALGNRHIEHGTDCGPWHGPLTSYNLSCCDSRALGDMLIKPSQTINLKEPCTGATAHPTHGLPGALRVQVFSGRHFHLHSL